MRLELDELGFFGIFIAFTLYMIAIVEGVIPKLFFLYWMLSVSVCAIYILIKRDKALEDFTSYTKAKPSDKIQTTTNQDNYSYDDTYLYRNKETEEDE